LAAPSVASPAPSRSKTVVDIAGVNRANILSTSRRSQAHTSLTALLTSHAQRAQDFRAEKDCVTFALAAHSDLDPEPRSFAQVLARSDKDAWLQAMDDEYQSLLANNTFEITTLPAGRQAIGCKWIHKLKYDDQGQLSRYKSRLVALGCRQVEGIDFHETFAPVAKFTSIRTLLSLTASNDWELDQMDVKTAFLNGDLHEEVYITPPTSHRTNPDTVWKLNKSLYGLKQAPRQWYLKMHQFLSSQGFTALNTDSGIYRRIRGVNTFIIVLYVDDLLLISSSRRELDDLKQVLSSTFSMTDMGSARFFLGLHIDRNRSERTLSLHQGRYIADLVEDLLPVGSRPVSTPLPPGCRLAASTVSDPDLLDDSSLYKRIVGKLMYAMLGTRPDLAYAVSTLSQHLQRPAQCHLRAAQHVLRYLHGTLNKGITYSSTDPLKGYSDADWAGCKSTSRSTSGYLFTLGGGAISWRSSKQRNVSLSSCESEYIALSDAGKEALWFRMFMAELEIPPTTPTPLLCDNQGSINLAKNPVNHTRVKHVDIRIHAIREWIQDQAITVQHCPTHNMPADCLTKAISAASLRHCLQPMGLRLL
jgi:hypothetical protein